MAKVRNIRVYLKNIMDSILKIENLAEVGRLHRQDS